MRCPHAQQMHIYNKVEEGTHTHTHIYIYTSHTYTQNTHTHNNRMYLCVSFIVCMCVCCMYVSVYVSVHFSVCVCLFTFGQRSDTSTQVFLAWDNSKPQVFTWVVAELLSLPALPYPQYQEKTTGFINIIRHFFSHIEAVITVSQKFCHNFIANKWVLKFKHFYDGFLTG